MIFRLIKETKQKRQQNGVFFSFPQSYSSQLFSALKKSGGKLKIFALLVLSFTERWRSELRKRSNSLSASATCIQKEELQYIRRRRLKLNTLWLLKACRIRVVTNCKGCVKTFCYQSTVYHSLHDLILDIPKTSFVSSLAWQSNEKGDIFQSDLKRRDILYVPHEEVYELDRILFSIFFNSPFFHQLLCNGCIDRDGG